MNKEKDINNNLFGKVFAKFSKARSENYNKIKQIINFNLKLIQNLGHFRTNVESIDLISDNDEKLKSLNNLRIEMEIMKETIYKLKFLIPKISKELNSNELILKLSKIIDQVDFSKLNDFSYFYNLNKIELYKKRKDLVATIDFNIHLLINFTNQLNNFLENDIN
jgi:hypothetical protein